MGRWYIAIAASAGLLLALAASAQAGGGHGRAPGQAFNPPGLSNLPTQATTHANFGRLTNSTGTISTPPGWANQTSNPAWSSTLGTVPPGLGTPPGHR